MWYRVRNPLQSEALPCLVGKQIFCRSSEPPFLPQTGQKKPSSGESPPGRCGPRPTYLMDVAESNATESSCMSNLKCSAHFSLSSLPSLVREDKRTFLHVHHVAVSINMPVLEPTHCPVKPLRGQNKSAGHFFLTEAEAKTSVSEERPPGRRGSRPAANHLMGMATRNVSEPLCESDLKTTAPLSLPRLPSFASRPAKVNKRKSLLGHRVDVSTKMPVLEPTRVPVKPLADPQKRFSVVVAKNLKFFQGI